MVSANTWATDALDPRRLGLIVRVAKSNSELQSLGWIMLFCTAFAKKFYHWIPSSWCYESIT